MATISWLFVIFGESQLAVLDLADWIVRSPHSESPFPDSFSSKVVNFYPATRMYSPVGGWFTSPSNHVTKSDDDPTSFTLVGSSADSPELLLRPSPATGHDAEILEV
jgi:hypothetical protein